MEDHHHIHRTPIPRRLSPNWYEHICVCPQPRYVQPQGFVPAPLDLQVVVDDVPRPGWHDQLSDFRPIEGIGISST